MTSATPPGTPDATSVPPGPGEKASDGAGVQSGAAPDDAVPSAAPEGDVAADLPTSRGDAAPGRSDYSGG